MGKVYHRRQLGGIKQHLLVGYGSLLTLGAIAALLIFPVCHDTAQAVEGTTDESPAGSRASSTISVTLSTSSVTTGSEVATSTGRFSYSSVPLYVNTNNKTGYNLYLTTSNGKTTLSNSTDAQSTTTINNLSTDTIGANMAGNTWGYVLSTTNNISRSSTFKPIPSSSSTAVQSTTSAVTTGQTDVYYLGFGAHALNTLPTGYYRNTVVISAVANYVPPSIDTISTMQEMTPEICQSIETDQPTDKQYQLKDSRDQKTYYIVHSSKDNNCWMTQNLAYDFNTSVNLTPADTDTTSNYHPPMNMLELGNTLQSNASMYDYLSWKSDGAVDGSTNAHSFYGNYYSYKTATLGGVSSGDAPKSVCPKGWRLPSKAEYTTFTSGLSGANIRRSPYTFLAAGYVEQSTGQLVGVPENSYYGQGNYWTSTVISSTYAGSAHPNLDSWDITPGITIGNFPIGNGLNVRCIAK